MSTPTHQRPGTFSKRQDDFFHAGFFLIILGFWPMIIGSFLTHGTVHLILMAVFIPWFVLGLLTVVAIGFWVELEAMMDRVIPFRSCLRLNVLLWATIAAGGIMMVFSLNWLQSSTSNEPAVWGVLGAIIAGIATLILHHRQIEKQHD